MLHLAQSMIFRAYDQALQTILQKNREANDFFLQMKTKGERLVILR